MCLPQNAQDVWKNLLFFQNHIKTELIHTNETEY